ncbi:MAG: hypothetical protein EXS31_07865 [Pedosphaera sp.]|nr:hypothetical protein [Pedosphaera sp.]
MNAEPSLKKYKFLSRAEWQEVREHYLSGDCTLRELGAKFGIHRRTVENKCRLEQWTQLKKDSQDLVCVATKAAREQSVAAVREHVAKTVAAEAVRQVFSAQELVRRTLDESRDWLDRIDATARHADHQRHPDAIRKLTSSWKDVVRVARLTHGLDQTGPSVQIAVFGRTAHVECEPICVDATAPDPKA